MHKGVVRVSMCNSCHGVCSVFIAVAFEWARYGGSIQLVMAIALNNISTQRALLVCLIL